MEGNLNKLLKHQIRKEAVTRFLIYPPIVLKRITSYPGRD